MTKSKKYIMGTLITTAITVMDLGCSGFVP